MNDYPTQEDEDIHPASIEVEFHPASCRQEQPQPISMANTTPEQDITTNDWEVVEHEDTLYTPEDEDRDITAAHPPDPDPTGPQEENSRYPTRSRTLRNPLQILWGGKSYE